MKKVILDGEEYEVPNFVNYLTRSAIGDWWGCELKPGYKPAIKSFTLISGDFIHIQSGCIEGESILFKYDNKCTNNVRFLEKCTNLGAPEIDLFKGFKIPSVKEYIKGLDIYAMNTGQFDMYTDFCDAVNDQEMYHEAR